MRGFVFSELCAKISSKPNIFQTEEWARFKTQTGYEKFYNIDGIFVLQKKLPFGRTMLYSPMIDQCQMSNVKCQNYISKLKNLGKENKAIFYRAEFAVPVSPDQQFNPSTTLGAGNITIQQFGFAKAFEEIQPEHTLILNIGKSEEEILSQMKPKGRYNIKVAEKHGVSVKKTRQIDDFYKLYEETAKRQKITYRGKKYFRALLDNLEPKGYCEVFLTTLNKDAELTRKNAEGTPTVTDCHCEESARLARGEPRRTTKQSTLSVIPSEVEGSNSNRLPRPNGLAMTDECDKIVLAAAIISFHKGRATYLFGASSEEMRNVMAPYKLHWEIIREAKWRNCSEYDFFGIAPSDDPRHPWAGVTRFKKQFGGQEVNLLGSWDLVLRPIEYQVFKLAEKLRRR